MPVRRNERITQPVCLSVIRSKQNCYICYIALCTQYLTSCKDLCLVFRLLPHKILSLQRKKFHCDKDKCVIPREIAQRKAAFYFSDHYSRKHNLEKNLTVNIACLYLLLAKSFSL